MRKEISDSPEKTREIARNFAEKVSPGDIICLSGEPGAGKTHFVQGFMQGMGTTGQEVTSPTFSLIHEYSGRLKVYHFDCYRLSHHEEALEIGAEEYLFGSGVCIIEWPEKIEPILPDHCKRIRIIAPDSKTREIIFLNGSNE